MSAITRNQVIDALRRLGFCQANSGSRHGPTWMNESREVIHPNLKNKIVSLEAVYGLGNELEAKGLCQRQDFIRLIRFS